ncbi:hypothetical protein BGZ50_007534, partial [Haplosporangium sp. Z 11]
MSESHIKQLRNLKLESRSAHVGRLQKEFERKYAGHEDAIVNYSVLNYLRMTESDGPSEAILTAIIRMRSEDDCKDPFLPVNETDFIDGDAENEENNSSNYDYEDSMS